MRGSIVEETALNKFPFSCKSLANLTKQFMSLLSNFSLNFKISEQLWELGGNGDVLNTGRI